MKHPKADSTQMRACRWGKPTHLALARRPFLTEHSAKRKLVEESKQSQAVKRDLWQDQPSHCHNL
jgi:hypothetical protein